VNGGAGGWTLETFAAGDGYRWHYRRYAPAGPPRANVVCVHGIQSHAGWYEGSCRRLAEAGFAVSFLDRRGAGSNTEARGDAPSFRRLLDDIAEYLTHRRTASPELRTFLVAISWGGKLAAALERRHPGLVEGLALLCPGFRSRVSPTWPERLRIVAARLLAPRKLFPVPLNDPDLFTANPEAQRFIRDDPLALRQATARLLVESVRLDGYLRWVPRYVRAPVLLMLAEKDRIIHNGRTRAFVERFASADREVIEYPGAHHTLEFEPEPRRWLDDLLAWLGRRAEPGAGAAG
jgi:alpha-beta hydrolase superfamily lysophospholipase